MNYLKKLEYIKKRLKKANSEFATDFESILYNCSTGNEVLMKTLYFLKKNRASFRDEKILNCIAELENFGNEIGLIVK